MGLTTGAQTKTVTGSTLEPPHYSDITSEGKLQIGTSKILWEGKLAYGENIQPRLSASSRYLSEQWRLGTDGDSATASPANFPEDLR